MNISLKIGFQKFDIDSIIESLNGGPWELEDEGFKGYDEDEIDDIMEMATILKAQYLTTNLMSFLKNFRIDLEDRFGDKSICFIETKPTTTAMISRSLEFDKWIKIVNNNYLVRCFFNKD